MQIDSMRTASLGDTTYLLRHEDSVVVVDPQRDIDRFLDHIGRDATVTHVLETHVHNDYVSGGRDLALRTGADLVLPAGSGVGFAFVPAFHQEDLSGESGLTIRPLHTPGHTPEHTSYLVLIDNEPHAVFSGGSLLVGAAGRSDLLGDAFAEQLSRLQYGSLHRLAGLPDEVGVFPTHGEGSFCTASGAGRTTSTIGQEKAENPLYSFESVDAFVASQLGGLAPYPDYYPYMAPINRTNPTAVDRPEVPELDVEAFAAKQAGAGMIDGRSRFDYAAGHIPGSIGIELGESFAPWAGWLFEFNQSLLLVLNEDQDASEAAVELARIGFTTIEGVLRGIEGWRESGRELAAYETATAAQLAGHLAGDWGGQILDVRDPLEWKSGHIESSAHCYLPDLRDGLAGTVNAGEPVWVICRTGNRSSIAAGLLEGLGVEPIVVATGGVPDVI
ncbi:MAG: MBL fold metallo-hydrolase [Acidimicrobiia bacterium]|nr:MBL fold metallo-hydrolase [Acidimicrobiia bacterium]